MRYSTFYISGLSFLFCAMETHIAVAEEPAIEDLVSESIQIQKEDENDQIDLDQGGQVEGGVVILDAAGRRNVSMACFTTDSGHRIKITVNNRNRSTRKCYSNCYYETSNGRSGTHRCSGTIRGKYDGEFCSDYESSYTFKVTDPGAFDCTQ